MRGVAETPRPRTAEPPGPPLRDGDGRGGVAPVRVQKHTPKKRPESETRDGETDPEAARTAEGRSARAGPGDETER